MPLVVSSKIKPSYQFCICIGIVVLIALLCFYSKSILGYRSVALILLMILSVLAMLFDIIPVLTSSILSALVWNFYFIPPIYTFHISNTEDILLFCLYFIIATVHAVLTFKIKEEEKKTRDKEEKEKTIELYNTLLNSLSHELKTPIATIIGAVDTIKENKGKLSESNQNELLNQIDIASIRLNKHVVNLLNMSRLETGLLILHKQWCDIHEMIHLTIQKFEYSHRIIIYNSTDQFPFFLIDIGILEQVLNNIISNAINYTPQNTPIEIETAYQNDTLTIVIADKGTGVPEESLELLFHKFYRIPNTKAGGTGLGLSISKGFVEAHNGTIVAENSLPNGLKFTIKLKVEISYINHLNNE